jgi:cytochrome c peroxidase
MLIARPLVLSMLCLAAGLPACGRETARAAAGQAAAPTAARAAEAAAEAGAGQGAEAVGFRPEILPLPADAADYAPIERYQAMEIPADNPLTAEKAALGRQLYYDARLSGDGVRSCYSCHTCENGLTDGRATALGAFDKPLTRASPTLWNIGYHWAYYWDGRAPSLEKQAAAAWTGANMGAKERLAEIIAGVNAEPGYAEQFTSVFGGAATEENIPQALAAYMRTIISDDTPWDRWQKGDEDAVSEAARRGWAVFQAKGCVECHAGVLLTDQQFHNVGIGMAAAEPDVGRFKVTNEDKDMGAFKTPTLRDVAQSAPYFHDGSVATLEEAVQLMLDGGIDNPHLSREKLKVQQASAEEQADLIAFLRSLDQPCDPSPPRIPGVP